MPKKNLDITYYFEYKRVTPANLQQDNLIYFDYHSPDGVHDKAPLVYVTKKELDRVWGFNVHYDSKQLFEMITRTEAKINKILETEYYKKYPEARKLLKENKITFSKEVISAKDLKQFKSHIMKKDMEQFILMRRNDETMRNYLYKRMNHVNKLIWRI